MVQLSFYLALLVLIMPDFAGDFTPRTPAGRSIFVVWALLGVGTMTILITSSCPTCSSLFLDAH